jgi:hypothetical protein
MAPLVYAWPVGRLALAAVLKFSLTTVGTVAAAVAAVLKFSPIVTMLNSPSVGSLKLPASPP